PKVGQEAVDRLAKARAALVDLLGDNDLHVFLCDQTSTLVCLLARRFGDGFARNEKMHAWLDRNRAIQFGHPYYTTWLENTSYRVFFQGDWLRAEGYCRQALELLRRQQCQNTQGYADLCCLLALTLGKLDGPTAQHRLLISEHNRL